MFGRKKSTAPVEQLGRAVLAHLDERDKSDPTVRLKLAGKVVYDALLVGLQDERGVRVENLLAILASNGGFACIWGVLHLLKERKVDLKSAGILVCEGADGHTYYFGDLPNQALLESQMALLSLALGAAQSAGASITMDLPHGTMKHVAETVGDPKMFGVPRLPAQHMPTDLPVEWVRHFWAKIMSGLDLYGVPPERRATALGFALQHAIIAASDVIDPLLAAQITVECAVPMAKIDPARVGIYV